MGMDWKTLLVRLGLLIVVVAAGCALLAIVMNGLILLKLMPPELDGQGFGYAVLNRTAYVMMVAVVGGLVSIFIRPNWRYVLLLAPLYAPSIFAVVFTLMHQPDAGAALPPEQP